MAGSKRVTRFLVHFLVWALVLFLLLLSALQGEVISGVLAGRIPLSPGAIMRAIGGQNFPFYVVFSLGAGFIAAHRTVGSFTFGAAYEQQSKQDPSPLWDDKPIEPAKVMHISPYTGETSEHGGFDREGNPY